MRNILSPGIIVLLTLLLSGTATAQAGPADPTLATIDSGTIRGVTAGGVISFKGIPYAAPPVGELRWRMPQSVKAWRGVINADKLGPSCLQPGDMLKSEDCLTLNVWRPANATQPLPVMVWIHGGAMVRGGASIYPLDALAAKGLVMVSLNYRLGRLGFFAHPALAAEAPGDVRGNYGFMDQLAALQWVKRNIAAFGGDASQVTIFGESAGGGSVLAHLVSPLSRGLFHRAILQSPGTPGPRAGAIPATELAVAEKMASDWARKVGVTGEGDAALRQLRALPVQKLVEGASGPETIAALSADSTPPGVAMSIIDGRFLTEPPEAALAAGRQAMVPTIIGANDRDLPIGNAKSKDELFALLGRDADAARKAYDPLRNQTLDELKQQVFADKVMLEPARHFADEMARAGQKVWLYRFGYVSQSQRGQSMGTAHGSEIPFVFNSPGAFVGAKATATDQAMADLASGYWARFGSSGDPNDGVSPQWPSHDPNVDRLMHVTNSGVVVGTDPLKSRLDLWQKMWGGEGQGATTAQVDANRPAAIPVTVERFVRAESDLYFGAEVRDGGLGTLRHRREMAAIDKQDLVRMSRDTLYSSGVFDLDAAPLTITLPDAGKRFMSMQVVDQDHYTTEVVYAPGTFSYTKDKVGTRYVYVIIRTLADPSDPDDIKTANAVQDTIKVEQASVGRFQVPSWDLASQAKVRESLKELGSLRASGKDAMLGAMFGAKGEIDSVAHLIGAATGWGGNPKSAAVYLSVYPKANDGKTVHTLRLKDVPVDGFWSVSVYNAAGYFEKNPLNAYSLSSLTAKPGPDGAFDIQFGSCRKGTVNCLPIMAGWSYTVRLYRPRPDIVDGSWQPPEAAPVR
jgi:para-nitrobenzyl esterase